MTGQPLKYRPQYGSLGVNPKRTSYSFVTKAALEKRSRPRRWCR